MTHGTQDTPDLLTGVEAQRVVDAALDMLDALECLILFTRENAPQDMTLDVWKQAVKAVKAAGGDTFANVSGRSA